MSGARKAHFYTFLICAWLSATGDGLVLAFETSLRTPSTSDLSLPIPKLTQDGHIAVPAHESLRVQTCEDASSLYRPSLRGPLVVKFRDQFLRDCFARSNNVDRALLGLIRSSTVHIWMGKRFGACSGALLSHALLMTARHCFKDPLDVRGKLNLRSLENAEVRGVTEDGKVWIRKGLSVSYDPFLDIEPSTEVKFRQKHWHASLDYLILRNEDASSFPPSKVSIVTEIHRSQVKFRTPLLVAAYIPEDVGQFSALDVHVNDLADCITLEYNSALGILRHRCQTLPSFSGTPVFVRTSSNGLELFGVHSGGTGIVTNQMNPDEGNEAVVMDSMHMSQFLHAKSQ